MKRFIYLLAVLASISILACSQQPTVDSIINDMAAIQGGADALAAIEDQVSTWESTMMVPMGDSMMAVTGEMTITFKRPNKIKFESKGPDGSIMYASGYDGEFGWVSMMGQTRDMVESEMQESATLAETWIDGWQDYAEKGLKIEMLADSTVDQYNYHVIQVTDRYGNSSLNFYNPANHTIERTEQEGTDPMTMERVPTTMTFANYAKHNGLMFPGKVASFDASGNMTFETNLKEVKHNVGVSDDAFAKPSEMSMSAK